MSVLSLACSSAFAETSATTLDTLHVRAIVRDSGIVTKTDTPIIEWPQSVSVVTDGQMRDRAIHGIEEAIWYTSGTQS